MFDGAGPLILPRLRLPGSSGSHTRRQCYRTEMPNSKRGPDSTPARDADAAPAGATTVVSTACPLDCPDSCSLAVTVQRGRVVALDGSHRNPVTSGFICAKVRHFDQRVYGPDRVLFPSVRKGRKGHGQFSGVTWEQALRLVADRLQTIKARWGGEAILPFAYGGSNGLLTHEALDATLWRRLGASRLARTICAAPTGAANLGLYGKMPSVS